MRRRDALLGATTALGVIAGCIEATQRRASGSADDESVPDSKGPVRGKDDVDLSVSVPEDDEDVEYLPERRAVRYVSARGDDGTEYSTTDWESWVDIRCASAAQDAAIDHAEDQLGTAVGGGNDGERVFVQTMATIGRDGEVVDTPTVAFDALVSATPRSVEATYELEGRAETTEFPAFARQLVARHD